MMGTGLMGLLLTSAWAEEPAEQRDEATESASEELAQETVTEETVAEESPGMVLERDRLGDYEVLLVRDDRAPLVYIDLYLQGGTRSAWMRERPANEAWTYTLQDPEGELAKAVDAAGVSLDFWQSSEHTGISLSGLKEDIPAGLELIQQALSSDIDEKELKRSNTMSSIQWMSSQKDPSFLRSQALGRHYYSEEDPRREEFEKPEALSTDSEELREVRDAILRLPGRVAGVAGDASWEDVESWLKDLLPAAEEAPAGIEVSYEDLNPLIPENGKLSIPIKGTNQAYLAYARTGLPLESDQAPLSLLARHALGGHFHARLYTKLRHEDGDTYGVSVRSGVGMPYSFHSIETFTKADNVLTIEEKLKDSLETLREEGMTQEELDMALSAMSGSRAFSRQSPSQVLDEAVSCLLDERPLDCKERDLQRMKESSLEDINAFIKDFYAPENFSLFVVEPG